MLEDHINATSVQFKQVTTLIRRIPGLILLDVAAATLLLLFSVFVAQNYSPLALAWIAAVLLLSAVRLALSEICKRQAGQPGRLQLTQHVVVLSAGLSGLIWGTTWLIHPSLAEVVAPRGIIIYWPALFIAGAAVNYAPLRQAFFAAVTPTVVLQIAHMLYLGDSRNVQIAGGYGFTFAIATLLSLNLYRGKLQAIEADLLVKKLRKDLKQEARELQAKESELLERVERERELVAEKQRSDSKLDEAYKEKLLLLDAINEGIVGISRTGKITFINPAALAMLEVSEAEVLNKDAVSVLSPSTTLTGKEAETRKALIQCIEQGTTLQGMQGVFASTSNPLLPVSFSCRPVVKEEAHFGIVLSFRDQTRQQEMEAKLVASQKMEAMGRITGGVAHDFNNLLTVIIGNLQFLKRRYFKDDNENGAALVDKVMSAAKSGAELNSRLLSYSREQSLQNEVTDIKSLLKDMGNFLNRILGEDISIQFDFADEPAVVSIDRQQFENVAMNLCLNARDAMPDGGVVTIGSRSVTLDESPVLRTNGHGHGDKNSHTDFVEVTFADTGTGVPPDIQQKIFDPFFTTKERGKGTGFGLSTAFGFLQQSGGSIRVESVPDQGAKFILVLPRIDEALLQERGRGQHDKELARYHGTVLIVEDDDDVRDIASETLLDAGYEVLLAENGNRGLELFQQHRNIDLVFSDIIMPGGLTGVEMAQQMQRIKPIPVLLATGYAEKMLKDKVQESSNILCIAKPYDTNELPGLIDSMLNRKAS